MKKGNNKIAKFTLLVLFIILIVIANQIAKRNGEERLF